MLTKNEAIDAMQDLIRHSGTRHGAHGACWFEGANVYGRGLIRIEDVAESVIALLEQTKGAVKTFSCAERPPARATQKVTP